jgi:molecular chaperone GrpE
MSNKEKHIDGKEIDEAAAGAGDEGRPPSHEELNLLLEDARGKADEHYNQWLRTQAELDNLRKRSARELENAHKYALEKFLMELLPVRDSLELGLVAADNGADDVAKLREGMELTLKMLAAAMEKFGVSQVDPDGDKFNPELHQAMSMQQLPEVEPNTVVNVVQKGYTLNDRLLRPAMVVVASGGAKQSSASDKGAREYEGGGDEAGQIDEQA